MSERWYHVALTDGRAVTLAAAEGDHPGLAIANATARVGRARRVWPIGVAAAPDDADEVTMVVNTHRSMKPCTRAFSVGR